MADLDGSTGTVLWSACITSTTPLLGDSGTNLSLRVVDKDTDQRSGFFSVDSVDWEPPVEVEGADGVTGWQRKGVIPVPASITNPSAILITKDRTEKQASVDFISQVNLITPIVGEVVFPCHSWVSSKHGERVFFAGMAYLPKDTPAQLRDDRARELALLRGEGTPDETALRKYDYWVYDDLATKPGDTSSRPPLGFTENSKKLPYPRRIDTAGKRGKDFLPYDEQFNYSKQRGFDGDTLAGLAMLLSRGIAAIEPWWFRLLPQFVQPPLGILLALLSQLPFFPKPKREFKRFEDVTDLYKKEKRLRWLPGLRSDAGRETARLRVGPLEASAIGKTFEEQQAKRKKAGEQPQPQPQPPNLGTKLRRAGGTLLKDQLDAGTLSLDNLLKYPVPLVEDGREGAWAQDYEFGRQMLAGMNPCAFSALKELPAGSAIKAEHVDDDLEHLGNTSLSQLLKEAAAGSKPRLFLVDYWAFNSFWGEAEAVPGREEHVGRCLLFLQQNADGRDTSLLPLAIELLPRSRSSSGQAGGTVYSRYQLEQAGDEVVLWQLAKSIFRSISSGHHQLISHWLRCHACIEPFLIAMRRTMSIMHPVMKLMLPHFRYTLNINTNARAQLINQDGTIESAFTPGAYALRLSSAVYRSWRFRLQALPEDLRARGMLDAADKSWLGDYPYADDGLELWVAFEEYFRDYLQLYYASDADVKEDEELQAWWTEVKTKAHPDIREVVEEQLLQGGADKGSVVQQAEKEVWGFAGHIPGIQQLVTVLATIAWTASAHHAAVNFGQYDYSALMLNTASLVRRPIPEPGAKTNAAWKALVNSSGNAQEAELLTYLSDFDSTLKVMTTVKLLSGHADDEQYLDEPNDILTDPAAVAANQRFISRMKALEVLFLNRNADPARWTRNPKGNTNALEYTLLYPSSGPGVTMRGVPYSVSI